MSASRYIATVFFEHPDAVPCLAENIGDGEAPNSCEKRVEGQQRRQRSTSDAEIGR